MKRFTAKEIAQFLCVHIKGNAPVSGFSFDSRTIKPGEVFFALKGQQVDSHQFLPEIAAKGAIAAIVSENYSGNDYGLLLIRVPNVLEALQSLAQKVLASQPKKIIVAITGSLGKTTTKEFTTTLLKQKFRVNSTPGNSNSQVSLPLVILNQVQAEDEVLVLEMGMTHPGNISNLIKIAPPDIAVITSVALVHACNFESLDEIGKTKAEIFAHPNTRLGILHREIQNFEDLCQIGSCRKLSFSVSSSDSDYCLENSDENLQLFTKQEKIKLPTLDVPGAHNLHNFLAAVTVARNLHVSWEEIRQGMGFLQLPEKRLQRVEKEGIIFINDSYNASLLSIKAAIQSLPQPEKGGRKIAVIGEMLELGKFSASCHREVGEYALERVDRIYCLGKECEPIYDLWSKKKQPIFLYQERSELVAALKTELKSGDVVLLKGSRAKQLWKVLEEI